MWLRVSNPFAQHNKDPSVTGTGGSFALPSVGVEAFTLEGDGGRVPLTYHSYVAVKARWLTRVLVDRSLYS